MIALARCVFQDRLNWIDIELMFYFISFLGAVVTLTDLPSVLPHLEDNVFANMPTAGWPNTYPSVLPLTWGQDHQNFTSEWDLVLCADIIYMPETYPLLLQSLTYLCKSGALVYLSSKMRKEHMTHNFFEKILQSRFHVELVNCDRSQNIHIYKASLKEDLWLGCI